MKKVFKKIYNIINVLDHHHHHDPKEDKDHKKDKEEEDENEIHHNPVPRVATKAVNGAVKEEAVKTALKVGQYIFKAGKALAR